MTPAARTLFLTKPLNECKKQAWKIFSELVRRSEADEWGNVTCVTCGKRAKWNEGMQSGHFIPGRNNAVLFDRRGVHVQCVGCNYFGKGAHIAYRAWMERKYGIAVINLMEKEARKTVKYSKEDYANMISKWVGELKKLD